MSLQTHRLLTIVAILGAVLWFGYEAYRHFIDRPPGDAEYFAANSLFKDGSFDRAVGSYEEALKIAPDHLPAMRGLANSLVQLKRYDEAIAVIERAMEIEPEFGGHYALRGIAYDHLGKHEQAMADYEKAIAMDDQIAGGMHWLDRLLYNVHEPPPTVADRLKYLKAEMAKPESERVLRIPEVDAAQRPYEH